MPKPRKGPRIFQRPGRSGWYADLGREPGSRNISLETDDLEQAQVNLADLIHRRAAEGDAPKKGELGPLFIECARRAIVNHADSYAGDVNRRLARLSRWLDAAGVTRPDKVTIGLVEKYKEDERARGIKDRTINRYLDSWKKAMKLAVDDGVAPPRVLTYFRKLKEPQHEPHQRGLTMDVIDDTLKAVDDERYYWLFRLTAGTGIRDDEARHVVEEWSRDGAFAVTPLDPGTCPCHPRGWTTKNFRYRVIPASADTVAAARAYAAVKHSMNLDSKKVWKELHRAQVAAGTATWPWSMHELRRAYASHMLAAGHKLQDISRWMGHADVKTTMRYLRVVEDEMPEPDDLPI